ncbi:YihY/virulence factor BrkB family protein [Pseudahrensia aquimaris]|uniref:YihY/virulence factor BrkB family protein n=1 Tax=Pseudahrensia aquimaris TaxID=744461 RepID=A0ABW3FDC8_9HYPH
MTESSIGQYAAKPHQIPWAGWKSILLRTYEKISRTDTSLRCAGAAFFTFLSIFPILACMVLVYGIVASPASLVSQLEPLRQFLPASVYDVIMERLQTLLARPETGLGIGLLVSFAIALWSGSRGTNALVATVNEAYREADERGFIASAGLSISMTLVAIIFVIIALFAIAAIPVLVDAMPFPTLFETLAVWLRWPLLGVLVTGLLGALYKVGPDREDAKWRWLTPGAAIACVLWLLLSGLFSFYVQSFGNFDATFGSLSVAVVMMLWLYYSTLIVALGATLNAELEHQTRRDTTDGPEKPMGERGAYVADRSAAQS